MQENKKKMIEYKKKYKRELIKKIKKLINFYTIILFFP